MTMLRKTCTFCGKFAWHNSRKAGGLRCTFCGDPPGSNGGSPKREYLEGIRALQAKKARAEVGG